LRHFSHGEEFELAFARHQTTHPFAHFAVYPEDICVRPILSSSRTGDVVLDPFSGTGTTGVVAKRLGRNFIGIDIKPEYLEIAKKRISEVKEPLEGSELVSLH